MDSLFIGTLGGRRVMLMTRQVTNVRLTAYNNVRVTKMKGNYVIRVITVNELKTVTDKL